MQWKPKWDTTTYLLGWLIIPNADEDMKEPELSCTSGVDVK